MQLNPF
jgi:hypothetical protein